MKTTKQLLAVIGLLVLSIMANAQNTYPYPSSGHIGIGTSSPVSPLHVYGTQSSASVNSDNGIFTVHSSSGVQMAFGAASSSPYAAWLQTKDYTNSGNVYPFTINPLGGNVGIGTTAPFGKLNISNAGSEGLEFGPGYNANASRILSYNRSASAYNKLTFDGATVEFQINDVAKMLIDESGNAGIGTTTPFGKLNVSNAGVEGLELGPGYNSNASRILSYNRTGITYNKLTLDGSALEFQINDVAKMVVDSNGYVGIGTISPYTDLQIGNSEGAKYLAIQDGANAYHLGYMGNNSGKLNLGFSSSNSSITERNALTIDAATLNVGIGTTTPFANMQIGNSEGAKYLAIQDGTSSYHLGYVGNNGGKLNLGFSSSNSAISERNALTIDASTLYVGIGTNVPSEMLSVNGNIKARKITVTQSTWPDYVFHPSYKLTPLPEVAQFIKDNQHLSGVPSAKEVEEKGVDLGDNQAILLKKIEELTLYIIDMKQEIEQLKKQRK